MSDPSREGGKSFGDTAELGIISDNLITNVTYLQVPKDVLVCQCLVPFNLSNLQPVTS